VDAKEAIALLRSWRAALCHVQLVPPFAIAGECVRAKSFREGTLRGAPWVRFSSGGIRVDAEPLASFNQRAQEMFSLERAANADAARFSEMREQKDVVPFTALRTPAAKHIGDLPGFWQPRFYDFNVYSHEKKNEKLD
jgi:hypothetical protein